MLTRLTPILILFTALTNCYRGVYSLGTDPINADDREAISNKYISSRLLECRETDPSLVSCKYNTTCVYGEPNTISCEVDEEIQCKGQRSFDVTFQCLYCWQLPEESYSCLQNSTCKFNTKYLTTCTVNSTTYCLGHREFNRYTKCKAVSGHKWSTTLVLSILFGGFGVDRFYLGHWQEGVGKLFSFGGFGVWTLIDTILISIGYLKPADSHYE